MAAKPKKGMGPEAVQLEAARAKREMEAARDALEADIWKNAIGLSILEVSRLIASIRNGGEGDLKAAAALVRHLLPAFNAAAHDRTIQDSPDGFALVKQWRGALLAVDGSADATAVADALAAPVKAKQRAAAAKGGRAPKIQPTKVEEGKAAWKAWQRDIRRYSGIENFYADLAEKKIAANRNSAERLAVQFASEYTTKPWQKAHGVRLRGKAWLSLKQNWV